MTNTKDIGDRSEAKFLAAFLDADVSVLIPFGDNKRYDMVLEIDGEFVRVQCKTGKLSEGKVTAATCSTYGHRGRGRRDYRGDVEFFGVFCPQNEKLYLVPIEDAPSTQISLRVDPPRNGQTKDVRWAWEYEFSRRLAFLLKAERSEEDFVPELREAMRKDLKKRSPVA